MKKNWLSKINLYLKFTIKHNNIEMDPSVSRQNRANGLHLLVYPKSNVHINKRDIDNIFCYGIGSASFRLKLTECTATTFGQHYFINAMEQISIITIFIDH